jgi:hypothetical protein
MERLSNEIYKLQISKSLTPEIIQEFSKINLNTLNLKEDENILVGQLFFHTHICSVNNYKKKYFMSITNYFTGKVKTPIYPLQSNLNLVKSKVKDNPKKYFRKMLKDQYGYLKINLETMQIFEIFNQNNVVIYAINIPTVKKKLKELKITKMIHLYTNPYLKELSKPVLSNLFSQVLSISVNSLDRRFYFFYNKIKIAIKERHILEKII